MNAERLMAELQSMVDQGCSGLSRHHSVAKLALRLLEEMPGEHDHVCASLQEHYDNSKCSCGYDNWQSAIETATRELCGGEDVQKG